MSFVLLRRLAMAAPVAARPSLLGLPSPDRQAAFYSCRAPAVA
jgi:hypothetical protein